MILSVETATNAFSISVFEEREIANLDIVHKAAHSQNIVSAVDFLLRSIDKSVSDITEAYTDIGPGSFTGTRIGVSFVNTLAQIRGIPILGLPSLDLLAFEDDRWYNRVIPFIRSRKNEVYTAFYEKERRVSDYLALSKDGFEQFVVNKKPRVIVSSKDDFQVIGLDDELMKGVETHFSYPKARVQAQLAQRYGLTSQRKYLKPLYIRGI